jgi:hypothetical protein
MKNNKEEEPIAQSTENVMEEKESKVKKFLGLGKSKPTQVDSKNRFYNMLLGMQNNRWNITLIVLFLFFFIIAGINSAVFFGIMIQESWKEMLLILLGAFVGNLNKVIDYWFNSEDRDKMLIAKVDEEDDTVEAIIAKRNAPSNI